MAELDRRFDAPVLVVGGGPAGMAIASCLKNEGVDFVQVDRRGEFGGARLASRVSSGGSQHEGVGDHNGSAMLRLGEQPAAHRLGDAGLDTAVAER